jgi:hypothetical protein
VSTPDSGIGEAAQCPEGHEPDGHLATTICQTALHHADGGWRGWITGELGQECANMIAQANGSYKASTTRGSTSKAQFYVQERKLRYRSSRTTGTVSLSEDKGTTALTVTPENPCVDCSQHLEARNASSDRRCVPCPHSSVVLAVSIRSASAIRLASKGPARLASAKVSSRSCRRFPLGTPRPRPCPLRAPRAEVSILAVSVAWCRP